MQGTGRWRQCRGIVRESLNNQVLWIMVSSPRRGERGEGKRGIPMKSNEVILRAHGPFTRPRGTNQRSRIRGAGGGPGVLVIGVQGGRAIHHRSVHYPVPRYVNASRKSSSLSRDKDVPYSSSPSYHSSHVPYHP